MLCFQKLVSDLGTFLHLCVNKIAIEFALVYEHKDLAFLIWDIFICIYVFIDFHDSYKQHINQ